MTNPDMVRRGARPPRPATDRIPPQPAPESEPGPLTTRDPQDSPQPKPETDSNAARKPAGGTRDGPDRP